MAKRTIKPRGRLAGESHPANKYLVEDIALMRLLAAERAIPKGLIKEFARARGASSSSLTMAIGGDTWSDLVDPPPVPPGQRLRRDPHRPYCPACDRRKEHARGCRNAFHRIDHRTGGWSRRP